MSERKGDDAPVADVAVVDDPSELERSDEPPVVARLVVEIRSDGSRTIARGAIETVDTGERVAIEARGTTPARLALSLARSMFSVPVLAGRRMRGLLPGRRRKKK